MRSCMEESPTEDRVAKQKGLGSEVRSQQDNSWETHKADLEQI